MVASYIIPRQSHGAESYITPCHFKRTWGPFQFLDFYHQTSCTRIGKVTVETTIWQFLYFDFSIGHKYRYIRVLFSLITIVYTGLLPSGYQTTTSTNADMLQPRSVEQCSLETLQIEMLSLTKMLLKYIVFRCHQHVSVRRATDGKVVRVTTLVVTGDI